MLKYRNYSCLFIGLCCGHAGAEEAQLRVLLDAAWNSPQVIYHNKQPSSGIFIDLFKHIGQNLNAKVQFTMLPRKRLLRAIENNEADLLCHINPNWIDHTVASDLWSGPFITQENVIIQPPKRKSEPINFAQLTHLNLGTVLGFQYPKLADGMRRGIIRRIDSPTQDALLRNTVNGLLDFSVANRLNVDYFNLSRQSNQRLNIVQTLDIQNTYCVIAPQARLPAAQIKAAIARLHSDQQIDVVLKRYRSEVTQ